MHKHIQDACQKAAIMMRAMGAILPNVGGPIAGKRRVLALALQSVVMYGAPAWAQTAECFQSSKKLLVKTQRIMALRVCSAYRTAPSDAIFILADMIPLHLLAMERRKLFLIQDITPEIRKRERSLTLNLWQQSWNEGEKGRWTHRLIPDISLWVNRRHGGVNYHLTQILTGHGTFNSYLRRIGKRDTSKCRYCEEMDDTAEHTLFKCPRWERNRVELNVALGVDIKVDNLISQMIESDFKYKLINKCIKNIITNKEQDEKAEKQQQGA